MHISSIQQSTNNTNLKGRVYINNNLSMENEAFLKKFLSNEKVDKFIKKKPYDLNAVQNNRGLISIKSVFQKFASNNSSEVVKAEVWYANLDKEMDLKTNINRLAQGVNRFETVKKSERGFNTGLERLKSKVLIWLDKNFNKNTEEF